MRPVWCALLLAALLGAGAADAKGTCLERCSDNLVRCSNRCNLDGKCMQRCQNQLDSCNTSCGASGETAMPMPKKCPDAKGRMVPCDVYSTESTKSPKPPRP